APLKPQIFLVKVEQSMCCDVGVLATNRLSLRNNPGREHLMKRIVAISAGVLIAGTAAFVQPMSSGRTELMTSVPAHSVTVSDWYKQNVYDPSNNKIGEIMDMLVEPNGQAAALIIGVGGFLGAGEKEVAVPFSAV